MERGFTYSKREACILFDPVNVRYALDTVNMSVYNMHNLTRYCFVPINGPVILYEYFNCEGLSNHLNLIDEIRPAITWDYFSNGDQAGIQLEKWVTEIKDLSNSYFKNKKLKDLFNKVEHYYNKCSPLPNTIHDIKCKILNLKQ